MTVSFRQRLCNGLARLVQKPLLALPLPVRFDRIAFDLNAWALYHRPADMRVEPVAIGSVPGAWMTREGQDEAGILLYLHGGGFVIGSAFSHGHLVARLAAEAGLRGLFVTYRLAPEHPFPAAPDDALQVYRHLIGQGHDPARIALAGDSAGGGLVAVLLQDIARAGLPMPGAAALISPVTDLAGTAPSMEQNRHRDVVLPASWARRAVAAYMAGQAPDHPRLSPLRGPVAGWPPVVVQVCRDEMLRDDGIRLAEKIEEAGGVVALHVWDGVGHVWHLMCGRVPEADAGISQIAGFLRDAMADQATCGKEGRKDGSP